MATQRMVTLLGLDLAARWSTDDGAIMVSVNGETEISAVALASDPGAFHLYEDASGCLWLEYSDATDTSVRYYSVNRAQIWTLLA